MKKKLTDFPYNVILASGSPRRKELLASMGISFTVQKTDVDESFPGTLKREEIARYLSELKAASFTHAEPGQLIITADTIVCLGDDVLNKPAGFEEAFDMLQRLSGKKHEVITSFTIKTQQRQKTYHVTTSVYFKPLSEEEIEYYIREYEPYDKAGGYGIQEWIGLIGIDKIEGSYFNVVGLPTAELYEALLEF